MTKVCKRNDNTKKNFTFFSRSIFLINNTYNMRVYTIRTICAYTIRTICAYTIRTMYAYIRTLCAHVYTMYYPIFLIKKTTNNVLPT